MRNEDVVTLFDAYSNDLYRFALSYLGSIQDAEDVVQDVFLKLLDKHMFFEKKNEKAYLMTMTANRCKDQLRSSSRNEIVDLESVEWQLADNERFTERHRAVFDELMRLEDTLRVPIYLHYYSGYSYKEISKILKISVSATAMRISRGKEQLRIRLEE